MPREIPEEQEPPTEAAFAAVRRLLEAEALRRGVGVAELVDGFARRGRALPPGGYDGITVLGPPSSGKTSPADRIRADLAARGLLYREQTVTRDGAAYVEFSVARPQPGEDGDR
ncbi:hypothetical protein [Kitasatospora purpeofusca]|uniref:hypothetical protein n=1 Tax=Kitasatospora purpeofusca TaxID=67352 RepID=UPI003687415A